MSIPTHRVAIVQSELKMPALAFVRAACNALRGDSAVEEEVSNGDCKRIRMHPAPAAALQYVLQEHSPSS